MSDWFPDDDGDGTPDERVLLEAESTEAFVERRRFQDLFEARSSAHDALMKYSVERYDTSPKNRVQHQRALHERVKAYVVEAAQLYRNTDLGQEMWEQRVLGPVHVAQALPLVDRDSLIDVETSRLPTALDIDDNALRIQGIGGYANYTVEQVPVTRNESPDRRNRHVRQETTDPAVFVPPKRICETAFNTTDELLAELDLMGRLAGEDYRADSPGA